MTKIPTESWDITGLEGDLYPAYKVGPICSVPGCTRLCDHAHHLVRRSFLGGDFKWVRMPDKVEIGNLSALCFMHHDLVTRNEVNIAYEDGVFYWDGVDGMIQLDPQPPRMERDEDAELLGVIPPPGFPPPHDEREKCPTCKRALPRPKIDTPKEDKKVRATWAVGVPVDAREDGADTLDALVEASREEMAKKGWEYGDASTAKFFVLSHALSMFVTNADQILGDS